MRICPPLLHRSPPLYQVPWGYKVGSTHLVQEKPEDRPELPTEGPPVMTTFPASLTPTGTLEPGSEACFYRQKGTQTEWPFSVPKAALCVSV